MTYRFETKHGTVTVDYSHGIDPDVPDVSTPSDDWRATADEWTITVTGPIRTVKFPFWTGPLHGEPYAADAFDCLLSDARIGAGSFREMCDELGYEGQHPADLYDTWEACVRTRNRLKHAGAMRNE